MQVASVSYFSSPKACLYFSSQDLRNPQNSPEYSLSEPRFEQDTFWIKSLKRLEYTYCIRMIGMA